MSRPMNSTVPPPGGRWPVTRLTKVVLPAPLAPMTPMVSPSSTTTSMSWAATTAPKDFSRSWTSRTADMAGYASSFPVRRAATAAFRPRHRSTSDHRPLGRNMMMASSVPPMMSCQISGNLSKA